MEMTLREKCNGETGYLSFYFFFFYVIIHRKNDRFLTVPRVFYEIFPNIEYPQKIPEDLQLVVEVTKNYNLTYF